MLLNLKKLNMVLSETVEDYLSWLKIKGNQSTVKTYKQNIIQFIVYVHDVRASSLGIENILSYIQLLQKLDYDNNTLFIRANVIKNFVKYLNLKKINYINPDDIPIPNKEFKRPRVITEDVYRKLLSTFSNNKDPRNIRNRLVIKLLRETGVRINELLALNIQDVGDKEAIIKTEKSNGRRPYRQIFWSTETQELLYEWFKIRQAILGRCNKEETALFIGVSAKGVGKRLVDKSVQWMLWKHSKIAGVDTVNAHSFRHAFGHDIAKNGSGVDVMNLLGHSTLASSTVYTQMYGNELKDRYRLIFPGRGL